MKPRLTCALCELRATDESLHWLREMASSRKSTYEMNSNDAVMAITDICILNDMVVERPRATRGWFGSAHETSRLGFEASRCILTGGVALRRLLSSLFFASSPPTPSFFISWLLSVQLPFVFAPGVSFCLCLFSLRQCRNRTVRSLLRRKSCSQAVPMQAAAKRWNGGRRGGHCPTQYAGFPHRIGRG